MAAQYAYVMKDMTKTFPGAPKPVLSNINLQFYQGAKIGIVGPNGAGKSTLMKIMAGIDTDFAGEAWPGENITVGYLPQEPQLDESKTVLENVKDGARETADLVDRYNAVAAEMAEPDADYEALGEEMNDLQIEADAQNISQKAQFQGTTSSLREQLKASEKRVSELEQETGTKEDFTQFMEVRLAKKEGDNMSLRETVATLEKEVDELRDAKAELEEAKASLADLQTKAAEATAVHQKIAAAYEKREALLREANEMRQEKMQALINLEVELTQLAANDQEEGNAAYLSTAMDKQQIDLDAMIDTADRGPEEEMEPQPDN